MTPYFSSNKNQGMVTMVDYTNLYIKNLDRDITSKILFELFRSFGEIISARVMKDTQTGLSKGYGFVSFRQMEDAYEALMEMNGSRLRTKHISVSFHEQKKTAQEYEKMQRNRHSISSSTKQSEPMIPFEKNLKPWNETIWMPIFDSQEHKLRQAIDQQLSKHQKKDLNELVELIQSLDQHELSLCLFNSYFLKQQIEKAYDIIHLFKKRQQQINPMLTLFPSLDDQPVAAIDILCSLEGMSCNKKKSIFGDILFPYVKATGIMHAPKVTIQLLDTLSLNELAFNMYNKTELTKKAYQAYIEIYGENSNPFHVL